MGGLTSGAKLAREGKKILLLEQHDRPGGCATTFRRRDFTMEVGLHEMDGPVPGDIKSKIFDELGIGKKLELLKVPEFYRFVNGRHDLVIPHDVEQAKTVLKGAFPHQSDGIDTYFHHLMNARRIAAAHKNKPGRSVGAFLDEILTDNDLKLVLLGNLGYFHDDPYTLSWLYYLNAQGSYYRGRASFIKGGSQELSDALMEVILENGGEVRLNSLVTKIGNAGKGSLEVQSSSIRGRQKGQSHSDHATDIVVNAALPNLAGTLLPSGQGKPLQEAIDKNQVGSSLLTVYFGFHTPLKSIGNSNYSTFVFDESIHSPSEILANNQDNFAHRSFTLVDYSQIDSSLAPEGKSVAAVCCIDYPSEWEGLDREEYSRLKEDVVDTFIERCEKLIPGFRDALEYAEAGTSLTVRRFTLNPGGAVYGFARRPDLSAAYLNALPEHIHVASAWGKYGGGYSGAMISGYRTALELL